MQLEVPEILTLRQTCTLLAEITRDKAVWVGALQILRRARPINPIVSGKDPHMLFDWPTNKLEHLVQSTFHTAQLWSVPRSKQLVKLEPKMGDSLLGLTMFLDRWLLVVYSDGWIYVWDTTSSSIIEVESSEHGRRTNPSALRAFLNLSCGRWTSYTASLDRSNNKVIIAITRAIPPCWTRIYEMSLDRLVNSMPEPSDMFRLLHSIYTPSPATVRAIETQDQLVALSMSSTVQLVRWSDQKNTIRISCLSEELEELWNGIVAVYFMKPYILIFKTRSIEIHHYLSLLNPDAQQVPFLRHSFHSVTFRDVSFSDYERVHLPNGYAMSLTLLAYDVLLGLFRYSLKLVISEYPVPTDASRPPSLEVVLTGVYPMANSPVYSSSPAQLLSQPRFLPGQYISQEWQRNSGNQNASRRGFLSAHALGPQGMRAVWVERRSGSTVRELHVMGEQAGDYAETSPIEIDRRMVYRLASYDLREDLTHCTFSESEGQIILANRSGDVFILELG